MSRSGYNDDCENLALWRGAVERAINGKRGQAFLREMAVALDAMPQKRLIAHDLIDANLDVCAIGAVFHVRNTVFTGEVDDPQSVADAAGIAMALAAEIEYVNDEANYNVETPEERFARVRKWVGEQIR